MGTRADFYVGVDPETMEWIGSIAWDGYAVGKPKILALATTEEEFRSSVSQILLETEDSYRPEQGWPWSWDSSELTDYAYAWGGGRALTNPGTERWVDLDTVIELFPEDHCVDNVDWPKEGAVVAFPSMAGSKNKESTSGFFHFVGDRDHG
jgi:hypothetical protein